MARSGAGYLKSIKRWRLYTGYDDSGIHVTTNKWEVRLHSKQVLLQEKLLCATNRTMLYRSKLDATVAFWYLYFHTLEWPVDTKQKLMVIAGKIRHKSCCFKLCFNRNGEVNRRTTKLRACSLDGCYKREDNSRIIDEERRWQFPKRKVRFTDVVEKCLYCMLFVFVQIWKWF